MQEENRETWTRGLRTSASLWWNPSWAWDPGSIASEPCWLDSHLPFLQLPPQGFLSPLQSACSREMNLAFHAVKSASMLPCLLLTTLQSPSPRDITRWAPSIQSHLSTFFPTCRRKRQVSYNSPPDPRLAACSATAWGSTGALFPAAARKKELPSQKGFRPSSHWYIQVRFCRRFFFFFLNIGTNKLFC